MSHPPADPTGHGGDVNARHTPVLLREAVTLLAPKDGETYIDATFGAGGYTSAILDAAPCFVLALDRDPDAIAAGQHLVTRYAGRLTLAPARFSDMAEAQPCRGGEAPGKAARVDGIVFDIGVSSMQLDKPDRGFSFASDGPLDMRMERAGASAADLINEASETWLADLLYLYGEERRSRAIARAIVRARELAPIETTRQLARLVEKTLGRHKGEDRHPATRTFQALRIAVNAELEELATGLSAAERLLAREGRLVIVTFHSLEDRIVKRFLARRGGRLSPGSRHRPPEVGPERTREASFRIVNQRPLTPSQDELGRNPRSRSAKLRWAIRTSAAAWPDDDAGEIGRPMVEGRHTR